MPHGNPSSPGLTLLHALTALVADVASSPQPASGRLRFVLELADDTVPDPEPGLHEALVQISQSKAFDLTALPWAGRETLAQADAPSSRFWLYAPHGLGADLPPSFLYEMASGLRDALHLASCEPESPVTAIGREPAADEAPETPASFHPRITAATVEWTQAAPTGSGEAAMRTTLPRPVHSLHLRGDTTTVALAQGILHAVDAGVQVLAVHAEGPCSRVLHAAIAQAVARNRIVLALAGSCTGMPGWPAAYPEVIAIGCVDAQGIGVWQQSASGAVVDVAAMAAFSWQTQPLLKSADAEQGFDLAMRLVSQAASLWLAHFGHDHVVAEARQRNTTVQALFRAALQLTARRPAGFPSGLGAGILDTGALLSLPLDAIRQPLPPAPSVPEAIGIRELLHHLYGPNQGQAGDAVAAPAFDWQAHVSELSHTLLEKGHARLAAPDNVHQLFGQRPLSQTLTAALQKDAGQATGLSALLAPAHPPEPERLFASPASSAPSAGTPQNLATLLPRLARRTPRAITLEASGALLDVRGSAALLDAEGRAAVLHPLRERADRVGNREELMQDIAGLDASLALLHRDGAQAALHTGEYLLLESLVRLADRPVVAVTERDTPSGHRVQTLETRPTGQLGHPLGDWQDRVALHLRALEGGSGSQAGSVLASVGRIDLNGVHIGTGFVIRPGVIATNRHVLQSIGFNPYSPQRENGWFLHSEIAGHIPAHRVTINFSPSAQDASQTFRLTGARWAGPNPILANSFRPSDLDLAFLIVEPVNAAGRPLPAPVSWGALNAVSASSAAAGRGFFLVGYPVAPSAQELQGIAAVRNRLQTLYGLRGYGIKYFSVGEMGMTLTPLTFVHDITSLPGNSGSPIGVFDDIPRVVGMHFRGQTLAANYGHHLASVFQLHAGAARAIQT